MAVKGLNFVRGTRIELELVGPAGTCIWINNWDPAIRCLQYRGDVAGGKYEVDAVDFLAAMSECGRRIDDSIYCLDGFFCDDGYVTIHDAMAVDWSTKISLCPDELLGPESSEYAYHASTLVGAGFKPALAIASVQTQQTASIRQIPGRFLVAAKRYEHNSTGSPDDFLSDRLYGLDADGMVVGEPLKMADDRFNGKLVPDPKGYLYQVNLAKGLVRIGDDKVIAGPGTLSNGTKLRELWLTIRFL